MLTRQGGEDTFEVIWPEKVSYEIGGTESFIHRKDDEWVFLRWYEEPDYKEEVIIRNNRGEITKTISGGIFSSPSGETWILQ